MSDTLLDVIHDTAKGLIKAKVMDATTMREFDALCLPSIMEYSANDIRAIREKIKSAKQYSPLTLTSVYRQSKSGKGEISGLMAPH